MLNQSASLNKINLNKTNEMRNTKDYWYMPLTLQIDLTSRCNCSCKYCVNKITTGIGHGNNTEVSTELLKGAISGFYNFLPIKDAGNIIFSGGEPLLRYNKLIELMEHAKKHNFGSEIITNAGLISPTDAYKESIKDCFKDETSYLSSETIVSQLVESGLEKINISVDRFHNSYAFETKNKVPLKSIAEVIKLFLDKGFGNEKKVIQLSTILENSGYDHLLKSLKSYFPSIKEKRGVWFLDSSFIKIQCQNLQIYPERKFDLKNYNELDIEHCPLNLPHVDEYDKSKIRKIPSKGYPPHWLLNKLRSKEVLYQGYTHSVAISWNGKVATCPMYVFPIGNINNSKLEEILDRTNMVSLKREYRLFNALWMLIHSLPYSTTEGNIGRIFKSFLENEKEFRYSSSYNLCKRITEDKYLQKHLLENYLQYIPKKYHKKILDCFS